MKRRRLVDGLIVLTAAGLAAGGWGYAARRVPLPPVPRPEFAAGAEPNLVNDLAAARQAVEAAPSRRRRGASTAAYSARMSWTTPAWCA